MKNYIYLFILLLASCSTKQSKIEFQKKLYLQAIQYNDLNTAKYALNNILTNCEQRLSCQEALDSLVNIYYFENNYYGAFNLLTKYGCSSRMMELKYGLSALAIGNKKKALNILEPWVYSDTTGNLVGRYYTAALLFEDNVSKIALNLLNEIVESDKSLSTVVEVQISNGKTQTVNIYSAAHALAANHYLEKKQLKLAKNHLSEALAKQPNFALVIARLNHLDQIEMSANN